MTPGQLVGPGRVARRRQPLLGRREPGSVTPGAPRRDRARHRGHGYAYSLFFRLSDDETTGNMIALRASTSTSSTRRPPAGRHHRSRASMASPRDITATTTGDERDRPRGPPRRRPTTSTPRRRSPATRASGCLRPRHDDRHLHGDRRLGQRAVRDVHVTVTLDTPPPPTSDLTGAFGRPLGDAVPALVGHAGRTIPLKLDVRDGTVSRRPATSPPRRSAPAPGELRRRRDRGGHAGREPSTGRTARGR